tara:strand:+ start:1059 stop:1292 length:234 start_codon:yes stop_codon:yes gene_type:complete
MSCSLVGDELARRLFVIYMTRDQSTIFQNTFYANDINLITIYANSGVQNLMIMGIILAIQNYQLFIGRSPCVQAAEH